MKRFTKEQLQEQAEEMMKAHNVPGIHATEDANFFLPANLMDAKNHAVANNLQVFDFGELKEVAEKAAGTPVELAQAEVDNCKTVLSTKQADLQTAKENNQAAVTAADVEGLEGEDKEAADKNVTDTAALVIEAENAVTDAEGKLAAAETALKAAVKAAKKSPAAKAAGDERK